VRYTSLSELGINLKGLAFEPMPEGDEPPPQPGERPAPVGTAGAVLTIAEAKRQQALALGVKADAVEITIRG
jgi:hypothetical protein